MIVLMGFIAIFFLRLFFLKQPSDTETIQCLEKMKQDDLSRINAIELLIKDFDAKWPELKDRKK